MKFTVTPLGGARREVGRVVDGIVRYLQPKTIGGPAPDHPAPGGIDGPSLYSPMVGRSRAVGSAEPLSWQICEVRCNGTTSQRFCPAETPTRASA
ncbi:MAG: hypothetical protein ACR2MB_13825 [Acidimicrobiales bacterium]